MKFSELPQEVQAQLLKEQSELKNKKVNTISEVKVYNEKGTRYFHAWRVYHGSIYGNYGNPSQWRVTYGKVSFHKVKDPLGGTYYELCYGTSFRKAYNDVEIPAYVDTKKEVMAILKQLDIFTL